MASIVIMDVLQARPLVSPAYDGGVTETEVKRRWLRHYRELHATSHDPDPSDDDDTGHQPPASPPSSR